ncbi:toll-like receptor 13 isoform X2 [Neodiprion virginianus]|uniref:toll-like receptor 13 isoform X2 n=1 Tax=Neodiprion virginianus TaxID=2961670 RepID=UPI001EE69CDA|nr:toll-like receptor 13 isoform X2 [Neodiprion virginianus]
MAKFILFTGIVVLLSITKTSKTLSCDVVGTPTGFRNKYNRHNTHAFSNEGFVQIKVPGKSYLLTGSRLLDDESYGRSDEQVTTSTAIIVQMNKTLENSEEYEEPLKYWREEIDSDDDLCSVSDLTVLSLESLQLFNLTSQTFGWLSNGSLTWLNMRYTDVGLVANDTLVPVQNTLRVLDMANASISVEDLSNLMQGLTISADSTERGSYLKILSFASLGLTTVPREALRPVQYSLKLLSLFGNDFSTFRNNSAQETEETEIDSTTESYTRENNEEDDSDYSLESERSYVYDLLANSNVSTGSPWADFPPMPFLVELDLRHCRINSIEEGSFTNLANLKRLRISNNNIFTLSNHAFAGLMNLAVLDLTFNRRVPQQYQNMGMRLQRNAFTGLYSLTTLNLSHTPIHCGTSHLLNRLPSSLVSLDLHKTSLCSLDDGVFEKLNILQSLDLSGVLENFPLLEHFNIASNYIRSWSDGREFAENPKLQGVYLHSNVLSLMTDDMLEDFKSLTYLTLANNSFICNCQLKNFMESIRTGSHNSSQNFSILIDYQSSGRTHTCTDVSLKRYIRFEDTSDYCQEELAQLWLSALRHVLYILILVFSCSFGVGGLIYWKWWYIKYVAVQIKNATLLSMINAENCEDRIYIYDIFVSYSDENRNWVIEELIPNIEGPEANLSICFHERDFHVGVSILENIIMGMDQSRTILLIISGFFIKSQWCQFEMHLAQHRLLETCREELVLVLLEEIPRRHRPKILHYLMMVKTYIVWPKDSRDGNVRKLFWKRLRRAITANKSVQSSIA